MTGCGSSSDGGGRPAPVDLYAALTPELRIRMEPLRAFVVLSGPVLWRPTMADLIFLALGGGLFAAFALFAAALRRV